MWGIHQRFAKIFFVKSIFDYETFHKMRVMQLYWILIFFYSKVEKRNFCVKLISLIETNRLSGTHFTEKSMFFRQINVFTKDLISRKIFKRDRILQYFTVWKN